MAILRQIFAFISVIAVFSQPLYAVTTVVSPPADTSRIDIRRPSEEHLSKYARQKAFDYSREAAASESFFSKIFKWLLSWLRDLLGNQVTANIIQIAAYLFFVFVLVLLVQQYFKGNLHSMVKRNRSQGGLSSTVETEHVSLNDLDTLISTAIRENQYRDAICYLYRRSLRQLANANHITWEKDKTNRDYFNELRADDLKSLFRDVTRYYEYAEYGHFPVDEDLFGAAHQHFKQLNKLITDQR